MHHVTSLTKRLFVSHTLHSCEQVVRLHPEYMRAFYLLTTIFFLSISLTAQGIQDGLVFYTPFDGSTVNLVEWVKPRNHGASFITDKFGYANRAISFDGNDDYLDYGNLLNIGKRNFSVSIWVKIERSGGRILSKGLTETSRGFSLITELLKGKNVFNIITADEKGSYSLERNQTAYSNGQWQHLVITRAGEEVQLYLNNELAATEFFDGSALIDADIPFSIGASLWENGKTADQHFQGALDEVRVYNRRLTSHDIGLLYNQFLNGPEGQGIAKKGVAPITLEVTTYPNPTSRILNLQFSNAAPRKLRIMDPSGRQVRYQKIASDKEAIHVSGLSPGTYFIRIEEGDRFVVKRFLKVGAVLP